jgi:hypothetical protein
VTTGGGVDQLRRDADPIAVSLEAAFEDVLYPEVMGDLA